jgi:hypothetical protein
MIVPQTKFISETLGSQASSVPRSSTIGIISFCFFPPCRDRVEPSRSDCSFMPPSPPPTSGGSVSVGPPRMHLRKSSRSFSMSGLTRKV